MGPRVHTKTKNLPAAFREAPALEPEGLESFLDNCVSVSLDGRRGYLREGQPRVRSEKIIHLPTMGVFLFSYAHFDQEEKRRLDQWCQNPDTNHRRLTPIHFVESPQGYVTIITEAPLETLDGLSVAVGGLPEVCLREAVTGVLDVLAPLHDANPPIAHGRISGKAIAITDKGAVKVDAMVGALEDKRVNPRGDLFDLGLTLILAALGGEEIFRLRLDALPRESGSAQWDTLQVLRGELQVESRMESSGNSPAMWTVPWLQLVMFNRSYSVSFIDFLHQCFCAESFSQLRNHPFLKKHRGAWPLLMDMQRVREVLTVEEQSSAQPAIHALLKAMNVTRLPDSFRTVVPHLALACRVQSKDIKF